MNASFRLDRIDLRILAELQLNGRISNVELAGRVHLSPSPCLARVKRLQSLGYISGYTAVINLAQLGEVLTVFTEVTLKNHRQVDFARFQTALSKEECCLECHLISGGHDYLLKFVTAGIADYQRIMESLIERDVGIDKYFSYVVIKSPLIRHNMPIERIFG
ncbi:Lrp/AsnC family transcriptional regulator [Pseudogemmobacter hezensis]|uniref:Lrp/AsnC family transcriptional regulator n=1 Tax=Pseudogemmobacter hezensis TaxID=2737662 RepID=UPI001C12D02B|nr:winged helix-turn-helix transcriptional regulator [Pseudogemmobacter hezensis]